MTEIQHSFLLKTSQILHPPGPLTSHWPDINHVATPNGKEGREAHIIFGSS